MKSKHLIYFLLAFCFLALSSCGPDNDDYANKVDGRYNVKITPNLSLKYGGNAMPSITSEIETEGTITKDDEQGNVTIRIDGVNGMINDIVMKAYCSGLGMDILDSTYEGVMATSEYESADCDLVLKNPSTTISNARVFNWNSTVSGQCEIYFIGLDMNCDVTGTINFALTPIIE